MKILELKRAGSQGTLLNANRNDESHHSKGGKNLSPLPLNKKIKLTELDFGKRKF